LPSGLNNDNLVGKDQQTASGVTKRNVVLVSVFSCSSLLIECDGGSTLWSFGGETRFLTHVVTLIFRLCCDWVNVGLL